MYRSLNHNFIRFFNAHTKMSAQGMWLTKASYQFSKIDADALYGIGWWYEMRVDNDE